MRNSSTVLDLPMVIITSLEWICSSAWVAILYALKRGNNKIITKHMQGVIRMALTEVPCKSMVKSVLGQPNIMSMIPFKPLHIKWQCGEGRFLQGGHSCWHTWKKIVHSQCLLKIKDSQVLFFILHLRTKKIQVFNYAPIEHYKTLWTHRTSQETALKFMNVTGSFAKNLRIFCDVWDTIFSQVSRVECPYCTINLYHSSFSFLLLTFLFFFPAKVLQYQTSTLQLYLH